MPDHDKAAGGGYPYEPIHDMHCDHIRYSCKDVGCYGADPNPIIAALRAKNAKLKAERDLLLIICHHATMLIDNEANYTAQAYAIVNALSNAVEIWTRRRAALDPKESPDD